LTKIDIFVSTRSFCTVPVTERAPLILVAVALDGVVSTPAPDMACGDHDHDGAKEKAARRGGCDAGFTSQICAQEDPICQLAKECMPSQLPSCWRLVFLIYIKIKDDNPV
jgi:hypothetical protein